MKVWAAEAGGRLPRRGRTAQAGPRSEDARRGLAARPDPAETGCGEAAGRRPATVHEGTPAARAPPGRGACPAARPAPRPRARQGRFVLRSLHLPSSPPSSPSPPATGGLGRAMLALLGRVLRPAWRGCEIGLRAKAILAPRQGGSPARHRAGARPGVLLHRLRARPARPPRARGLRSSTTRATRACPSDTDGKD